MTDPYAMYVFYLRVIQSIAHAIDDSHYPVLLFRAPAFFGQVGHSSITTSGIGFNF